ncbi:MAG: hypothetical protein HY233_06200 [Acidobacteriales bacterium]|nr:hypothetical protein [Terriglobales bacterium]
MKHPGLLYSEPRIAQQAAQRWGTLRPQMLPSVNTTGSVVAPQRDWNVSLGAGRLARNMFPAKYSFDPGAAPSCANDYVVFGLSRVGAANQANLVAFNNLYAGTTPTGLCGTAPTFFFAYNISTVAAGRILNSPALSLDGKKIAFVESGNISGVATSIFHVVTWASGPGNGTSATAPAVPGVGNSASMTSLAFAAALDTRSSPWVDYDSDTAYVGADDGKIYKITGVFKGTPTLAGAPWPVTISLNVRASTPVLDSVLGLVMVGSQNGTFYSINATTGAVNSLVVGASGGTNPGILAAPIVDVTNGTSFVVSANDGTSGVLVEVDTATMTQLAKARIGLASKSGTAVSLFQPAFSDDYFIDPSIGVARLCGTGSADITPWQYSFGFTGTVMDTTPVFSEQLLTSTAARCTGWTEFFNPFVAEGTDFFFFGLTVDCGGAGTSGCVVARTNDDLIPAVTADIAGGPSGIVVDNYSTAVQASSIYFSGALTPNLAYKLTQDGLN